MSNLSTYLAQELNSHALGQTTYTPPSNIYLALYSNSPGPDNTGTEITGGSYARVLITFATSVDGISASDIDAIFTTATAAWGNVAHMATFDALTAGNMLRFTAVPTAKDINDGDTAKILTGNVIASMV